MKKLVLLFISLLIFPAFSEAACDPKTFQEYFRDKNPDTVKCILEDTNKAIQKQDPKLPDRLLPTLGFISALYNNDMEATFAAMQKVEKPAPEFIALNHYAIKWSGRGGSEEYEAKLREYNDDKKPVALYYCINPMCRQKTLTQNEGRQFIPLDHLTKQDKLRFDRPFPAWLDMLWGSYFASGNMLYVKRIIDFTKPDQASPYRIVDKDNKSKSVNIVTLAAIWSLIANVHTYPEVRQIVESELQKRGGPTKNTLQSILDRADNIKNNNGAKNKVPEDTKKE